jgi:hypothetical protein
LRRDTPAATFLGSIAKYSSGVSAGIFFDSNHWEITPRLVLLIFQQSTPTFFVTFLFMSQA